MIPAYEDVVERIKAASGPRPAPVEMYPVEAQAIIDLQDKIDHPLPSQLIQVWEAIGSGFFSASLDGGNECQDTSALLPPEQISKILDGDDWPTGVTPFFDVADGDYLSIGEDGTIRFLPWGDVVIAPSVKDFIVRVADDPLFWKAVDPYAEPGNP